MKIFKSDYDNPALETLTYERNVLGYILINGFDNAKLFKLDKTMFSNVFHEQVFQALCEVNADGDVKDTVQVIDRFTSYKTKYQTSKIVELRNDYIHCDIEYNIEQLFTSYCMRLFSNIIDDAQEFTSMQQIYDTYSGIESIFDRFYEFHTDEVEDSDIVTMKKLYSDDDVEKLEWLVPNVLAKNERLFITGVEGGGKSTFIRQFSMMLASGIHPFTFQPIEPKKVLIVDCENTKAQMLSETRSIVSAIDKAGKLNELDSNLFMKFYTFIDLSEQVYVQSLLDTVERIQPDLLIVTPLVKLNPSSDLKDASDVNIIFKVFDKIRELYKCGLIVEMHSPLAQNAVGARLLRPRGSSAIASYPEFGFGLRKKEADPVNCTPSCIEFEAWRGERVSGRAFPNVFEWSNIIPFVPQGFPSQLLEKFK